jgi:diguanylate cyclase (GGDEF)-like protein
MAEASAPHNEAQRVASLHALHLLDVPPEERFDRLTRLAKRLFDVPLAKVTLVDTDKVFTLSCSDGGMAAPVPRDVSFCSQAIMTEDILVIPDATADARYSSSPLVQGEPYVRFYAGCPLTVPNGSRLGTLCLLDTAPREFSAEDRRLMRDLAAMVEQEMAAVQMATMCDLTGISNRRGFELLGQQAIQVCKRLSKPAALLYFDLNHFKEINDTHGHAEGDKALKIFSEVLRRVLRSSDLTGRLGGDEFAALLIDSDWAETTAVIERLRSTMAARNAVDRRGYDIRFSVGQVALVPVRHATIGALLAEGDADMYRNKVALRAAAVH